MIDNYLVDARQRFDLDNEMKAKQKLVTNSPYVYTNFEFWSYNFIFRIFVMISFFNWQIEEKKLCRTNEKFVFSFNCSNWKNCGKKLWKKFVKQIGENIGCIRSGTNGGARENETWHLSQWRLCRLCQSRLYWSRNSRDILSLQILLPWTDCSKKTTTTPINNCQIYRVINNFAVKSVG